MIVKKFGVDFQSHYGALTLNPDELGFHGDGWRIEGEVIEDYFEWINYFEAQHPVYGRVWGDFEDEVYADSEEAFKHFYLNHPPTPWDYGDI
jgi:hypothetical protein